MSASGPLFTKHLRALGAAGLLVVTGVTGSCASTLDAGEVGTLRYGGRVKGEAPLNLLPPVADPTGNVYVLNGSPKLPETHAFVGFAGGGWSAGCNITKGDVFGAHGWAGFAKTRQWYWSGSALVAVSGTDGECHAVLNTDPSTGADLLFQAVVPGVRNLAERTTLVAIVQSPTDVLPFSALVDLDAEFLTNVRPFQPSDAYDIAVIGVGGDREQDLGVVLVQYRRGAVGVLEARYFDQSATPVDLAPIGGGPFAPYAVEGYLQIGAGGRVAGVIASGDAAGTRSLITFDRSGGNVVPIVGMDAVGVHVWEGDLWLVGTKGSDPLVAPIDAQGRVGAVRPWSASVAALRALGPATAVRDDRSLPSRATTWTSVRSAMGVTPFVHAHALVQHAPGTTLWLFAGPSVSGGAFKLTSFAMAPVGVSYP